MTGDKKTHLIKYTIYFVCTALLLTISFSTPDYVINVMAKEGVKIENNFGAHTLKLVDARSLRTYDETFIQSGAYAAVFHLIIPTRTEQKLGYSEKISKGILLWVQDRVNLLFILLFLLVHRFHLILMLAPSASFILFASMMTGVYIRKIKQGNFAFASPTVHRYAIGILTVFLTVLPFVLLLPVAISPSFYSIAFICISIMIQAIISNVAKRI